MPLVERITPAIEAMAGAAGSELSRGGMQTKIEAGKIATNGGTHMVIASGRIAHPLAAIADGARCTWFLTPANPVTARKKWIAGSLEPKGTLTIDAGAVAALRSGKSLLPAGVIRVDGAFARGDAVVIRGPDGAEIGRGLVAYDAEDADKIKGRSSADILSILGFGGRAEMVHRDDLVVGRALSSRSRFRYRARPRACAGTSDARKRTERGTRGRDELMNFRARSRGYLGVSTL